VCNGALSRWLLQVAASAPCTSRSGAMTRQLCATGPNVQPVINGDVVIEQQRKRRRSDLVIVSGHSTTSSRSGTLELGTRRGKGWGSRISWKKRLVRRKGVKRSTKDSICGETTSNRRAHWRRASEAGLLLLLSLASLPLETSF
jgi:hypothetical protein